jgi:UDP-N-acetylglucosamine 2-epimerase (non-hydrolysing)
MPEEINRIVADHLSEYLFAPSVIARKNLIHEGIPRNKIYLTGNTIVDAVLENLKLAGERSKPLNDLGLCADEYFIVTLHRQENVDNKKRLKGILTALARIHDSNGFPLVFPIHPRTEKMIKTFGLKMKGFKLIKPLGYLEFLQLESKARLMLTDSGGIQEESCILKVPCVTIRNSTERPETIEVGANIIAGVEPGSIIDATEKMLEKARSWKNPFGDGKTGNRIVKILNS